jgi:lysophospholipase L1-like esterase
MSKAFDAVRRAYTGISLILMTTIIMLVITVAVLEVVAGWLLKRYNAASITNTADVQTEGYSGKPWYERYWRDVQGFQASTGGKQVYEPYSLWKYPNYASETFNVENGYRKTVNPAYDGTDSVINVFTMGASTLFCVEVPDECTISSYLSQKLHEVYPGKKFRVTNYGISGFVNQQEAILLSKLLTEGERPDVVIFYDGVNDARIRVGTKKTIPHGFYELYNQIFHSIKERLWANLVWKSNILTLVMKASTDEEMFEKDEKILISRADSVCKQYVRTVDYVHHLSQVYGFSLAFFWQPSLLTTHKTLTTAEKLLFEQNLKQNGSYYSVVQRTIEKNVFSNSAFPYRTVFNLNTAVDSLPSLGYFDSVHLTAEGNQAVATSIVTTLQANNIIR